MNKTDVPLINPFVTIAGSMAFVAGLAWNDAIQSGISKYYPAQDEDGLKKSFQAKIIYALVVTIFIILFAFFLRYLNQKAGEIKTAVITYGKNKELSQQYMQVE